MIVMSILPFITLSMDLILIVASGSACVYCIMLNRRLKKLNDLETGVGASIMTLTTAIENTYKAAQEAQASTQAAVENLQVMLNRSEVALPEYELIVENIETTLERARDRQSALEQEVHQSLQGAISEAQSTAQTLMKAIENINTMTSLDPQNIYADNPKADTQLTDKSEPKSSSDALSESGIVSH